MSTTTTDPSAPATTRPDLSRAWPAGYRAMIAFDATVAESGLETSLLNLAKQRASQINGCAFCLDMHAREARADGEDPRRLDVLGAWREVPLYTPRERAALALTEAVTLVADGHVPDEVIEEAQAHFSPEELAQLVWAIVVINSWNRIAITSRMPLPPVRA